MKKMRVVLVDDEIMIREGFKKLFNWEEHDCQVVGEASDGMEALTVIEELLPDIVIMDINIPIMNGLKVIQTWHLLLYLAMMIFHIAGKRCGCRSQTIF